jgi:glycosyltransferase involved in cell wall biosynthesis
MKLLSVVTPAYNRRHTLDAAYKSLLHQTNKDFKWIIVDDGSTDNTKELIDGFIARFIGN